jgi:hypothetical protein
MAADSRDWSVRRYSPSAISSNEAPGAGSIFVRTYCRTIRRTCGNMIRRPASSPNFRSSAMLAAISNIVRWSRCAS